MSEPVIFENPPPARRGDGKSADARHKAIADNPGRWLLWRTSPSPRSAEQLARHLRLEHGYAACARGTKVYAASKGTALPGVKHG